MEAFEKPAKSTTRSIAHLIAWLSVCMLAAAWGSVLGPGWTLPWMHWGAFGLAAAVGLGVSDRLRAERRNQSEQVATISRLQQQLHVVEEAKEKDCTRRPFADSEPPVLTS